MSAPGAAVARKAAIVLSLLALWEAWTRLFAVSPLLFPPASTVLRAFVSAVAGGDLPGYAGQSLKILLSGMAMGAGIALALTTLAVTTRLGAEVLQTLTSMFNPLPAIALMPLALLWFGLPSRGAPSRGAPSPGKPWYGVV